MPAWYHFTLDWTVIFDKLKISQYMTNTMKSQLLHLNKKWVTIFILLKWCHGMCWGMTYTLVLHFSAANVSASCATSEFEVLR